VVLVSAIGSVAAVARHPEVDPGIDILHTQP